MSTSTTTIRAATAGDIRAMYGRGTPYTVRAWVMEIDGAVKGIAGFRMDCGGMLVFSDVASDVPKMTIWRKAVEFMKMVRHPVICVATETSGPFLERLGWVKMAKADDGDVYAFNPNESEAG